MGDQVETIFPKDCLYCIRTRLECAEDVKNHYRDKHKRHKEPCEICGYCFINEAELEQGYCFINEDELEQHKNAEHWTRPVHKLQKKNPRKKNKNN